jgi:cell division protein FtsL
MGDELKINTEETKIDTNGVESALYKQYSSLGFKGFDSDYTTLETEISKRVKNSITHTEPVIKRQFSLFSFIFSNQVFNVIAVVAIVVLSISIVKLVNKMNSIQEEANFNNSVLEISTEIDNSKDDYNYINDIDADLAELLN